MSSAEQTATTNDRRSTTRHMQGRFTFSLATLFLIVLVLTLMAGLAVNRADSLVLLYVAIGGIFGSIRALRRMRQAGVHRTRLHRVILVLCAATRAGGLAGMFTGPFALWIALLRANDGWPYDSSGWRWGPAGYTWDPGWREYLAAVREMVLSGTYASSVGALLGACGALLVGPIWAYLAARRRNLSAVADEPRTASLAPISPAKKKRRVGARAIKWAAASVCIVGLVGFPAIAALYRRTIYRDLKTARQLDDAGLHASLHHVDRRPIFFRERLIQEDIIRDAISPYFLSYHIIVDGEINDRTLAALRDVPAAKLSGIICAPNDEQLDKLSMTVKSLRIAGARKPTLNFNGNEFTPTGLERFIQQSSPSLIFIDDAKAANKSIDYLATKPASTGRKTTMLGRGVVRISTKYRETEIICWVQGPPPEIPIMLPLFVPLPL